MNTMIETLRKCVRLNCNLAATCLIVAAVMFGNAARALEGDDGVFDPSSIVKMGSTYHIFTDGTGIVHKTSSDLVSWKTVGNVLGSGAGPAWIQSYCPGFKGYFWAPEIVFMGGTYYVYYSCSPGLGSPLQCIGCATSKDLVKWTDQGLVVAANAHTNYAGIDPSVCKDAAGHFWLTWGSWRQGIFDAELNPATGKLLNSTKNNIVNVTDAEGSKMNYHHGYYYCFYNQGTCCSGITSTYTIWVARSSNPAGPFTGDTIFIGPNAPIYAPGQFGYFDDGGTEYATFHYDDGNSNGFPRLFISHLSWNHDWPVHHPEWIASGTYKITNAGSGLALTGGATLKPVTVSPYTGAPNQRWTVTNLGWNLYKITTNGGRLALDAFQCESKNGTPLDLYGYWSGKCQQFNAYRSADGSYVFSTYTNGGNGTTVVSVPGDPHKPGSPLDLGNYTGSAGQKWVLSAP